MSPQGPPGRRGLNAFRLREELVEALAAVGTTLQPRAHGKPGKAVQVLLLPAHQPAPRDVLAPKLRERHPPRTPDIPRTAPSMCHLKAAGPSGWTEELVRDAITEENEHTRL